MFLLIGWCGAVVVAWKPAGCRREREDRIDSFDATSKKVRVKMNVVPISDSDSIAIRVSYSEDPRKIFAELVELFFSFPFPFVYAFFSSLHEPFVLKGIGQQLLLSEITMLVLECGWILRGHSLFDSCRRLRRLSSVHSRGVERSGKTVKIEENSTTVASHYDSRSRTLRLANRSVRAYVPTIHPGTRAHVHFIISVQQLDQGPNKVTCITLCEPTTIVRSISIIEIISKNVGSTLLNNHQKFFS